MCEREKVCELERVCECARGISRESLRGREEVCA